MTDIFKKAALFNAELISIGAEKLKEVADDFVRNGILDDQEARRFVLDVREKLTAKEQELEERLHQVAMQVLNLPVTQQVAKLGQTVLNDGFFAALLQPLNGRSKTNDGGDNRVDELERQLDDLRARKETLKARNGAKKDGTKDEIPA